MNFVHFLLSRAIILVRLLTFCIFVDARRNGIRVSRWSVNSSTFYFFLSAVPVPTFSQHQTQYMEGRPAARGRSDCGDLCSCAPASPQRTSNGHKKNGNAAYRPSEAHTPGTTQRISTHAHIHARMHAEAEGGLTRPCRRSS